MQIDLFDPTAASERDAALQRVTANNASWMDRALRALSGLQGGEATGEDIKIVLREQVEDPGHHNAWGALIRKALHQKMLTPTGRFTRCRLPKSHARQTPIYHITTFV
tara:strand:+ start:3300 stop:3623 length:324 start_codon:yes stop_codon:yes gene_type:complete